MLRLARREHFDDIDHTLQVHAVHRLQHERPRDRSRHRGLTRCAIRPLPRHHVLLLARGRGTRTSGHDDNRNEQERTPCHCWFRRWLVNRSARARITILIGATARPPAMTTAGLSPTGRSGSADADASTSTVYVPGGTAS